MNITDINRTILELENDSTTFENCYKLASLYIIRERYNRDVVEQELDEILPQYIKYRDVKRKYQLGEISENAIERQIKVVCKEVTEFINTLYASTDMPAERNCIKTMIIGLQKCL